MQTVIKKASSVSYGWGFFYLDSTGELNDPKHPCFFIDTIGPLFYNEHTRFVGEFHAGTPSVCPTPTRIPMKIINPSSENLS